MTAVYVGSMSIGGAIPGADAAATAGVLGLQTALPDLAARVASLQASIAELGAIVPSSFVSMAASAGALLTAINAAIATPGLLTPPNFSGAIVALTALLGSLSATLGTVEAQLALLVSFRNTLGAAGVHVVAFDGPIGSFGSEVGVVLASPIPSGNARAVVLATTSGATWSAMSQIFRVTP